MDTIQWRSKYNVGDDRIDTDHQKIVSMLGRLQHSQDTCLDPSETALLFQELEEYSENHFAYEEELLVKIHFPYINSHKKDHHFFKKTLSDWKENEEIPCKSQKISVFLIEWLFEHILLHDMKIKEYLPSTPENQ